MQDPSALREPLLACAPAGAALKPRLTTLDSVAVALSLSLGAGAWVTAGVAARDMAGPAVVLAFLIAGAAALLAALCYAGGFVRGAPHRSRTAPALDASSCITCCRFFFAITISGRCMYMIRPHVR
jgi:hypothetical protein